MAERALHTYLQAHWAAAAVGTGAFARAAKSFEGRDDEVARELHALTREIQEDRETLRSIMSMAGTTPAVLSTVSARVANAAHRLTPRGLTLLRGGPPDVLRVEMLRPAVMGKRSGWDLLRALAEYDDRLDGTLLDKLIERADGQLDRLQQVHHHVGVPRLQPDD